ncbi:MAG: cupredoxin domain-containing protein [Candidatus Acidiferrales bacterium]
MSTPLKRILLSLFVVVGIAGLGLSATILARADKSETPGVLQIRMRDYCDPPTFNDPSAAGPGTCIGTGLMPFGVFIHELGQDKSVGEWRFNPDAIQVEEGTTLSLENLGGELHTLTRVEKFGGGFVAPLNGLSGNPVPAPECAKVLPDGSLVPQPESPDNQFVEAGTTEQGPTIGEHEKQIKYMCCVHPWMRLVVNPKKHEHDDH